MYTYTYLPVHAKHILYPHTEYILYTQAIDKVMIAYIHTPTCTRTHTRTHTHTLTYTHINAHTPRTHSTHLHHRECDHHHLTHHPCIHAGHTYTHPRSLALYLSHRTHSTYLHHREGDHRHLTHHLSSSRRNRDYAD